MTGRLRVAVVVLNWNNADDTLECLRSLALHAEDVTSIVVDNGSTDGSADEIEASGLAAVLLRTGENLGFAGGNNVGLRYACEASYDVVVVLNNDTVVLPHTLSTLVRHAAEPGIAVSPLIRYDDGTADIWFQGGVIDRGWPRHLQPSEVHGDVPPLTQTPLLTGCCIAAARATWERVGDFDERLFLIFEDSDWSMRARASGVRLLVVRESELRHKVSRSFRLGPMAVLGSYYFVRNGLWFQWRYSRRHLPRAVSRWVVRPTLRGLRRRSAPDLLFVWAGAVHALIGRGGPAPQSVVRRADRVSRRLSQAS